MSWLALIKVLLSVVNTIAGIIREKQLMDAGEARATAKSLAEIAVRLKIGEEIRAEVAALTDAQIDEELMGGDQP